MESWTVSLRDGEATLKVHVVTGYRSYEFPTLRHLLDASGLSFPPESLAGAIASL
ncbi:hypothetical protein ABZ705_20425 [Streptomyces sp. NPDC006984]|uniref:hypothetical protein n=1 Tax=Streptomyces sp. NPDC006984 TaxID=3155463 RepID=UPI0033C55644